MATKWEKMLRGTLYGKNKNFGNYAQKYPVMEDTMDGKWRAVVYEDGTVKFSVPLQLVK